MIVHPYYLLNLKNYYYYYSILAEFVEVVD